jgi:hypothetical protein
VWPVADGTLVLAQLQGSSTANGVGVIEQPLSSADEPSPATWHPIGGLETVTAQGFDGSNAVIVGPSSENDADNDPENDTMVAVSLSLNDFLAPNGETAGTVRVSNAEDARTVTGLVPSDGGFVIATQEEGTDRETLLQRFDASGSLDKGFGDNGSVSLPISGARLIRIDDDDSFLVIGNRTDADGQVGIVKVESDGQNDAEDLP